MSHYTFDISNIVRARNDLNTVKDNDPGSADYNKHMIDLDIAAAVVVVGEVVADEAAAVAAVNVDDAHYYYYCYS